MCNPRIETPIQDQASGNASGLHRSSQPLYEQERARGIKAGDMGLKEGHPAHVPDAAEVGRNAWEEVSQAYIARCVSLNDILLAQR